MVWQGSLFSCFLSCAAEFLWEFRHARPRGKYLSCLIFLASKGRFLTVCGERVNRSQNLRISLWNYILKVSAIFNFETTWASNPISLANWLIRLSPIHTFTAHSEKSAFRGQKYQTWQIFSSRPCVEKFSGKLPRTREETAEQTALPGHFAKLFPLIGLPKNNKAQLFYVHLGLPSLQLYWQNWPLPHYAY